MRRVGLEELTAKTPEPAHDFNLVISPLGTILVLPVATATGRASVFYSFSSGSFGAICSQTNNSRLQPSQRLKPFLNS